MSIPVSFKSQVSTDKLLSMGCFGFKLAIAIPPVWVLHHPNADYLVLDCHEVDVIYCRLTDTDFQGYQLFSQLIIKYTTKHTH